MVLFSVSHKAIKGIPLHSAKSLVQWIIVNCSQLGYPVTSGPCVLTSSATGAPCRPLPGPPPSTSQVCSHSCRLKFEPGRAAVYSYSPTRLIELCAVAGWGCRLLLKRLAVCRQDGFLSCEAAAMAAKVTIALSRTAYKCSNCRHFTSKRLHSSRVELPSFLSC